MSTAIAERKPSLYEIETSLQLLMQDREETQDPEELAAIDAAIQEYVGKEIAKVDRVRSYIRYAESKVLAAKQAASDATSYAQIWENRIRRVKDAALMAMQTTGAKRLEGTAGTLSVRGNGGVTPLIVTDESLLPLHCIKVRGALPADVFDSILRILAVHDQSRLIRAVQDAEFKREPDNGAIRAKLLEPCERCGGAGIREGSQHDPSGLGMGGRCEECGGSGKQGCPGAYLGERGAHLEVR
jgi:hypothetical protein